MRPARILIGWLIATGMLAAIAAGPPGAGAAPRPSAYQRVLRVYERDGAVPACQFSGAQLERALGDVDTYGAQYFADFTQAIQTALSAAASGACARPAQPRASGPGGGAGGSAGGTGRSGAGPPVRFGPLTAATSAGVPAPLLAMGALAVGLGLWGGARELGRRRSRTS